MIRTLRAALHARRGEIAVICGLLVLFGILHAHSSFAPVLPGPAALVLPGPAVPNLSFTERWLRGVPCAPPCWEGITPGKTTADQAYAIIKQLPEAQDVEYKKLALVDCYGTLHWTWRTTSSSGVIGIVGDTVSWIDPGLPATYRIADVIARYGPPNSALAETPESTYSVGFRTQQRNYAANPRTPESTYSAGYSATLIFVDHGFLLTTSPLADQPFRLSPESGLAIGTFFRPGSDVVSDRQISLRAASPWVGFEPLVFKTLTFFRPICSGYPD